MYRLVAKAVTPRQQRISGGDALTGNTRSHSEHDGKDVSGRWYYAGDGMEEQVAAGFPLIISRVTTGYYIQHLENCISKIERHRKEEKKLFNFIRILCKEKTMRKNNS